MSAVAVPTTLSLTDQSVFSWKNTCFDDKAKGDHQSVEKYEALVFLLNTELMVFYEFYPAKNKLKKLPSPSLKYMVNQTNVLYLNGKVYVTGGVLDRHTMAVEEYDADNNYWSTLMQYENSGKVNSVLTSDNGTLDFSPSVYFFKLKMFIS